MRHVSILVLKDSIAVSIVGMYDILRRVNSLHYELTGENDAAIGFEVMLVNAEKEDVVYSDSGFPIYYHNHIEDDVKAELIIIPALRNVPEGFANDKLLKWLTSKHQEGAILCSVCTGAFIVAQTGLLEGKEATVSWFAAAAFKARYPNIEVKNESILVDNGNLIMAGASTSFLNLGIYLIEKYYGKKLANYCAKILLINKGNVSQKSYSIFIGQKNHQDEEIHMVQQMIETSIHRNFTVTDLIKETSLSKRTFIRRFKSATGISPLEYIQRTKVEYAKKELENGESNISQISYSTGYSDLNFFRQIFKRYTGLTPSQYHKQFSFHNREG